MLHFKFGPFCFTNSTTNDTHQQEVTLLYVNVEQKRILVRAFQGHQPITEVDLHLDHVLEHAFFSRLREAKTPQ